MQPRELAAVLLPFRVHTHTHTHDGLLIKPDEGIRCETRFDLYAKPAGRGRGTQGRLAAKTWQPRREKPPISRRKTGGARELSGGAGGAEPKVQAKVHPDAGTVLADVPANSRGTFPVIPRTVVQDVTGGCRYQG